MEKQFNTPVLFIIFNRPDTTQQVFKAIRQVRPKYLYVAADGPRPDKIREKEKCEVAREIIKQVDWDCEVKTLFRNNNLGCKIGVSSAISWFFDNVEEGIILEDDCVSSISFLPFCSELLEYYRNDKRIMMISGDNFLKRKYTIQESYYFSRYHFIWGWATWRRAWKLYDINMQGWFNNFVKNTILNQFESNYEKRYWENILSKTANGEIDTWDYQWAFTLWNNNGLTICPSTNLVTNIGAGIDATHTKIESNVIGISSCEITFPLKHPTQVERDFKADKIGFNMFFKEKLRIVSAFYKLKTLIKRYWPIKSIRRRNG